MLSASMTIISCKGDKGDLGLQGQNGQTTLTKTTTLVAGSTECPYGGTKIEVGLDANNNGTLDASEVIAVQTKVVCNGAPGTANVQYSNWMRVTDAAWTEARRNAIAGGDTSIIYSAEIPTPAVTQEILDKGIVAYYMRDASPFGKNAVKQFEIDYAYNDWYNVGVTNRTYQEQTASYSSYSRYWLTTDTDTIPKGKLTIFTRWEGGATFYNPNEIYYYRMSPLKQKYNELKPKTDLYFRYVIIPGGTLTTGKVSPVDLKNYQAVAKYYGIKD